MIKSRAITAVALILAFAAGIPAGWTFNPFRDGGGGGRMNPAWLSHELDLTADQREKLSEIWSNMARKMDGDAVGKASREKDAQVIAIMTNEQKAEYNDIMRAFRDRKQEIEETRRNHRKTAIEKTMEILTVSQQEAFEAILAAQNRGGNARDSDRRRSTER